MVEYTLCGAARVICREREAAIWLESNIRFHREVRTRARELASALGAYEAYREARRLRMETPPGDEQVFAYNVELAAAELAGLSPGNPRARPLGPEAPIWFLPFLTPGQVEALRAWIERLLARLMGAPAKIPAPSAPPRPEAPAGQASALPDLTARQIECLRWTAEGKSSWDIAQILGISPRTVDEHLDNACRKLGTKRRSQAAIVAARAGLL